MDMPLAAAISRGFLAFGDEGRAMSSMAGTPWAHYGNGEKAPAQGKMESCNGMMLGEE